MKEKTLPEFPGDQVVITFLLLQVAMRALLGFMLSIIVMYTCLYEDSDILITKIAHRCLLFNFSAFSFHLWARGMGWKGTLFHLAAVLLILISDDSKPNNAAPLLLVYVSISIAAIFVTFNSSSHVRQMYPPFHILGDREDAAPLLNNILQDVVYYSSESESEDSDGEHLPPGLFFLDGPFILGAHPQDAVTAG